MISVIIPTYKEPDYLDLCLQSAIKNQNEQNYKKIIIIITKVKKMKYRNYKRCNN